MDIKKVVSKGIDKIFSAGFSLLPIDRELVLFEGNKSYDDNGRAVFDEMIREHFNERFRIVWFMENPEDFRYLENTENVLVKRICRVRDLGSSPREYLEYIRLNCLARMCIYSNAYLGKRLTSGQTRIYLTHGTPLKNCRLGSWKNHDVVCAASEFTVDFLKRAIPGVQEVAVVGLPRNDSLFRTDPRFAHYFERFGDLKRIIWMPTFKHSQKVAGRVARNDLSEERNTDLQLLNHSFLERLNAHLANNDVVLFIKFHPFQDMSFVENICMSHIVTLRNSDLLAVGAPLYSFIGEFDAMVTDFSSVAFDYMLLNRPLAYDLTDFESYSAGIGFMVDRPLDYMPGVRIFEEEDFFTFIDQVSRGDDPHRERREAVCELFNAYRDNKSSKRAAAYIQEKLL